MDPDCPEQSEAARSLAADACSDEGIFLATTVLVETVWVLRSRYRLPKKLIAANLRTLMMRKGVIIDRRLLVERALSDWEKGSAGFSDYLILNVAEANPCRTTYTFETRKMSSDPRATRLPW